MTCYSPWRAFLGREGVGVATLSQSPSKVPVSLPCGRCLGCRMSLAREWGIRIQHEAAQHRENSFLTLTYRDEDLPFDGSVSVREVQLFIKRLRFALSPVRIRYYGAGEYGDERFRPHYHLIIFGYGFPDKKACGKTKSGMLSYRSAFLESVWPFGDAQLGTVTAQSGAYIARYVLKKIGGAVAEDYYTRPHPVTGEMYRVEPEFATMSSRPGIGHGWWNKWHDDAYPTGYLVYNGRKVPVPRYYRNKVKERLEFGGDLRHLHRSGVKFRLDHADDLTDERLAARGELQAIKQAAFKRDLGEAHEVAGIQSVGRKGGSV